jgi:hypothetical protein
MPIGFDCEEDVVVVSFLAAKAIAVAQLPRRAEKIDV